MPVDPHGPETDVDPDFLALPDRSRRRIDHVFNRAIAKLGPNTGTSRKRRKLNSGRDQIGENEGGFVDDEDDTGNDRDEGGFVVGTDDGGGFIPDDEEGGGFVPDDDEMGEGFAEDVRTEETPDAAIIDARSITERQTSNSTRIPLSRIPALLAALGLPADEDVLAVFRSSASGWAEDVELDQGGRRRMRGGPDRSGEADAALGVERKDFRAVCAVLMGGEDEEDGDQIDDAPSPIFKDLAEDDSDSDSDEDGEEDAFDPDDDGSSLSSLTDESEYGPAPSRRRAKEKDRSDNAKAPRSKPKGKGKADHNSDSDRLAPRRRKKRDLVQESGAIKLNSRQKEMVRTLWTMLKPPQAESGGSKRGARGKDYPTALGRDEVKRWARELGEMWTDEEIGDMVSLFSTQHEGRGLSYDDFGQVMARARLV